MWETFISWYINAYLGKYIENLNSQQVSFGLSHGALELENLQLKKNIFRSWGLPVEVRSGVVGRIKFEFNLFKYFSNEPVYISFEDIYLVAGPINLSEWDQMEEQAWASEVKMSDLDSHEGRWRAQSDLSSNSNYSSYSKLYISSMQIGASILTKVVENLQFNVRNIHIRFEEEIGSRSKIAAFGLTLESLIARSCDSNWDILSTAYKPEDDEYSYKIIQLNKFGIYCDPKGERFSHISSQDLNLAMKNSLTNLNLEYLLNPVSATARVAKNNSSNPLLNSTKPRFDVYLIFEKVPLLLTDLQYSQTVKSYRNYKRLKRNCRLRHYRPFTRIKNHAFDWWIYAFNSILIIRGHKIKKRLKNWTDVLRRGRDNILYVEAYKKHLMSEFLTTDHQIIKDQMEADLDFEEIIALREIAMFQIERKHKESMKGSENIESVSKRDAEVERNSNTECSRSSVISWLFPSWTGTQNTPINPAAIVEQEVRENIDEVGQVDSNSDIELKPKYSETELEDAILEDMRAYGRDALLARFEFILEQGVVALKRRTIPFLELDFGGVQIKAEFKPRSNSKKFQMKLSTMMLKDCKTKSLVMSPHISKPLVQSFAFNKNQNNIEPLFYLFYDRRPNRKALNKICVTTKPLNLVIYPSLWEDVKKYFKLEDSKDLLDDSQSGYEAMKKKTKEELKIYWDRLMDQKNKSSIAYVSKWEIYLDISAPQIVILQPELFQKQQSPNPTGYAFAKKFQSSSFSRNIGPSSTSTPKKKVKEEIESFVVIDLGRFKFTNAEANDESNSNYYYEDENIFNENSNSTISDDNEEFLTPCSSPVLDLPAEEYEYDTLSNPNTPHPSISIVDEFNNEIITSSRRGSFSHDHDEPNIYGLGDFQAKLYKKYRLEITDVQVLVVEKKMGSKDPNWNNAIQKGTSPLHLVDRFSITMKLDRRLIYSEDPHWPSLTLVATLPKLNLHFNESKLVTIQSVFSSFLSEPRTNRQNEKTHAFSLFSGSQLSLQETEMLNSTTIPPPQASSNSESIPPTTDENTNCTLFLAEFTIQNISVEIQSKGRSIAELQINRARTSLTRRNVDTCLSFVIQSLLLVDAVQTFGPDFELLVASHKHVSMDTASGQIRDSEPTSPLSPQSPPSPSPRFTTSNQATISSSLHQALVNSLQQSKSTRTNTNTYSLYESNSDSINALINAELVLVHKKGEEMAILNVQFNTLDVIANQETLVEIYYFIQQAFPSTGESSDTTTNEGETTTKAFEDGILEKSGNKHVQIDFEFHRLNILLLRGIYGKDGNQNARKIATVTALNAKVDISIKDNELTVEGSLGGLQLLNLTPEGKYHQRVLSIGQDPLIDTSYNLISQSYSQDFAPTESALTFIYEKHLENKIGPIPSLKLKMASVIYTHCPIFLIDLRKCINEFQAPLTSKLKSAAAQIAFGLVRPEGNYGSSSNAGPLSFTSPYASLSGSFDGLNLEEDSYFKDAYENYQTKYANSRLKLDFVLDSPVIVLPRNRKSPEVLVANLGQITLNGIQSSQHNFDRFERGVTPNKDAGDQGDQQGERVNYEILICDVSLYTLNLQEKWNIINSLKMTHSSPRNVSMMRAEELYNCDPAFSKPILHNTVIKLSLSFVEEIPYITRETLMDYTSFSEHNDNEEIFIGSKLEIEGRVVNSNVRVSLLPQQYAQVLDSLNNISAVDEILEEVIIAVERRAHWENQLHSMRKKFYDPIPLPSPTKPVDEASLHIIAKFEIPELNVELVLPYENEESPHLCLSCTELSFECNKKHYTNEMTICLKSLLLEDTSVPENSLKRILAMSKNRKDGDIDYSKSTWLSSSMFNTNRKYSYSCPDLLDNLPRNNVTTTSPINTLASLQEINTSSGETGSCSLPDRLDPNEILFYKNSTKKSAKKSNRYRQQQRNNNQENDHSNSNKNLPGTPPPSPRPDEKDNLHNLHNQNQENLVQIQMCLVEPKSPLFISKYKGTQKFIDVDFNELDVSLHPESFCSLRRFFSDASDFSKEKDANLNKNLKDKRSTTSTTTSTSSMSPSSNTSNTTILDKGSEETSSETRINVKALKIKMANEKETLVESQVVNVMCHIVSRGSDFFGIEGRLGALQIKDISSFAGKYPIKFVFQGKQALDFDYSRKDEAKFRLQMSSAIYVHTHRFYSEFYSLLCRLFAPLSPIENEDSSKEQLNTMHKSTRLNLDIQARAPMLLFPFSYNSENLLVADLGHLSVKNKLFERIKPTSYDLITVDLMEMDLFAAELKKYDDNSVNDEDNKDKLCSLDKKFTVVKIPESPSFLHNKCALNLKVIRQLSTGGVEQQKVEQQSDSPNTPRFSVQGTISAISCSIDPEKYKLLRGFLEYNISEKLEGPANHNIQVPLSPRIRLGNVNAKNVPESERKSELSIELDLLNVALEVLNEKNEQLSKIDFIKSKFTFTNWSDSSKDIDLASQEILIQDSRSTSGVNSDIIGSPSSEKDFQNAKNVFKNILQQSIRPIADNPNASTSKSRKGKPFQSKTHLQAEVHYRQSSKGTHYTIVLNNMRVMLILDWWMEIKRFISQKSFLPYNSSSSTFEESKEKKSMSPLIKRSRRHNISTHVPVSTGIITKRGTLIDVPTNNFEIKMNITNCEIIAVEDPSIWDSNAIILKSTSILSYQPNLERPLSCNILHFELFSCILGLESETALSLLDPTTIQFEIISRAKKEGSLGLMDATSIDLANLERILKFYSPQLNLRLSYNDMKMFVKLIDRFSKQAQLHLLTSGYANSSSNMENSFMSDDTFNSHDEEIANTIVDETKLEQLVEMGFSRHDSIEVLQYCEGSSIEDAISMLANDSKRNLILTRERKDSTASSPTSSSNEKIILRSQEQESNDNDDHLFSVIEFKCNSLSICVIDDCRDVDVPFIELSISQMDLFHERFERFGKVDCVLNGDYYNRGLSGWEPFLEAWRCRFFWSKNLVGQLAEPTPLCEFPGKAPLLELTVDSNHWLNINLTSSLLNLYRTVSSNWAEDYLKQKTDKRRHPFVPYALKNETGSPIYFSTIISNNENAVRMQQGPEVGVVDETSWIKVLNGATQSFSFEGRGKLRHRNTHQLRTHKLIVKVDGWQEVSPISVDRVGTYFRVIKPISNSRRYQNSIELPASRLVFEVSLEGSAQKLVRIRSPILVKNSLPDTVELKLENTLVYPSFELVQTGGSFYAQVRPNDVYRIPLHSSVYANIWVKPMKVTEDESHMQIHQYTTKPLKQGNICEGHYICHTLLENRSNYQFCVAVKKDEFPADEDEDENFPCSNVLITLLSTVNIINRLPQEFVFEIKNKDIKQRVQPGKEFSLTNISSAYESLEIIFTLEGFQTNGIVHVNPNTSRFVGRIKFLDLVNRPLVLNAKVQKIEGGSINIEIYCPYWIINKSGIPIIYKQEGTVSEAAGQYAEHEIGRMVSPFMFNPVDHDAMQAITLRFGVDTRLNESVKPHWSRSVHLQNGVVIRKLSRSLPNHRHESINLIGVEIYNGKGKYRDTKLIKISPRYVINNLSEYTIYVSQREFATTLYDPRASSTHISLPSNCHLPFNFPRPDKEQLLCIRIDGVASCQWSGGFPIETVDSFQINIRDGDGYCYYLRAEIILQGPTYFITFSDVANLPSPIRIDNWSFVPVTFHQSCIKDEKYRIITKPESSCSYSWDELTETPQIILYAPGGSSVTANMNTLGHVAHLTYENFFYIALTATFSKEDNMNIVNSGMETLELVFDVPEGTKVVLRRKEPGKRSQLWRVNADGLIEHEGSSPPRDSSKKSNSTMFGPLVLDIAGKAIQPTQHSALMLRRPDVRRKTTQTWEFTQDGRLKCSMYANLFVQAIDGFGSRPPAPVNNESSLPNLGTWNMWSDVVLGPTQPICYTRTENGIQAEQSISIQKLRAGSGHLSINILTDGPSRVLRIIDVEKPPKLHLLQCSGDKNVNLQPTREITIELKCGFAISLINCSPREELLHARFMRVNVNWVETDESIKLNANVKNIQIDNQLHDGEKHVFVYVTPSSSYELSDEEQVQTSIVLSLEKMKTSLNIHAFKNFELHLKPLSIIIDERLALKLYNWIVGNNYKDEDPEISGKINFEVANLVRNQNPFSEKRFYFGLIKICPDQVRLTVLTSAKLSPELIKLKKQLGFTIIRFEDAVVDLDSFVKEHPFETFDFLSGTIKKHFKEEIFSQAMIIFGSTDFLGNPLGFVNDVSVGVSGLIYEGSVGALVKNVTHGISNSAAKVAGTLGDGLGRTTLDERHEDERRKIREDHSGSSGEHLVAGLRGLGHGLMGGVTSMIYRPYEGAANEGVYGFFTGVGKGLVGTVTKPAIGVLDLATGAAAALRDTSKTASRMIPQRMRSVRVTTGNGGLLPPFTETASKGQEILYEINNRNYEEFFIACEVLKTPDLSILVSSLAIYIISPGRNNHVMLEILLKDLLGCKILSSNEISPAENTPFIEFTRRPMDPSLAPSRPQVVCESIIVAKRVVQQVMYAKIFFEETRHTSISKCSTVK